MDKPSWPLILSGQPPLTVNELFSRPERWAQRHDAENRFDEEVELRNPNAVKWCLGGALRLVYGHDPELLTKMINSATAYIQGLTENDDAGISDWNDHDDTTFKDIRTLVTTLKI